MTHNLSGLHYQQMSNVKDIIQQMKNKFNLAIALTVGIKDRPGVTAYRHPVYGITLSGVYIHFSTA